MKAMSEGVASIVSLATRKVLRCNKELLEPITVISVKGANCKLMKSYDVEAAKSMNIHVDTVWLFEVQDAEDGLIVVMAPY
ncbi:hypothetical protein HPB47_023979 [Ixodes persulcatus]|uniref:Uncharacterized protein n=1 Tax=Ixodes persulcatus TaxID=34615 RepID=A0AC60Q5J7_IXOPE|nr:hypothetical protein HPB47_023979 [Ixodes persulcatus]